MIAKFIQGCHKFGVVPICVHENIVSFVFCAVSDHAPKIGTVVICPRHGMVNVGIE